MLLSYEEVVNALRPLDRLETLSKAAARPGAVPVQRTFLQAGGDADGTEDEEEPDGRRGVLRLRAGRRHASV